VSYVVANPSFGRKVSGCTVPTAVHSVGRVSMVGSSGGVAKDVLPAIWRQGQSCWAACPPTRRTYVVRAGDFAVLHAVRSFLP
jgi:hypothetical protein